MEGRIKVAILDAETVSAGDVSLEEIEELGECSVRGLTPKEEVASAIGDADAVICNKCPITMEVFDACPNLRYVGLFATGYNNVDVDAANEHGAVVCNVPSYSTDSVAQHTFALILDHFSRAADYERDSAEGKWIENRTFSRFCHPTAEISGLTIGIVGYGAIGRKVAEIARAFGMNVITNTRSPSKVTDGTPCVGLDELLRHSDVVTLHCPLTRDNARMIDADALSKMKNTALLVNTARGGLIDEPALADALRSHRIAAAKLDTLTVEPMSRDCPLFGIENCGITPHVAWTPIETRRRLVHLAAENLRAWAGGSPTNVVSRRRPAPKGPGSSERELPGVL